MKKIPKYSIWWETDKDCNPTDTPEVTLDAKTKRAGAKHLAYTLGGENCTTFVRLPDGKMWFGILIF